ncbi:glycoside hydrolase family 99-like domain-containing protein [bacterium]|nr:glycoside hydrolase family 99-like domain-containing protein [bacterium]
MKKNKIKSLLILILGFTFIISSIQCNDVKDNSPDYEIAAYYFPNYHPNDIRNKSHFGDGWSEWDLVKNAKPRFSGHYQPKVPLWGYVDESDSKVMEKKISVAAHYGIDAFIFDWYYYDDGPFLEKCLEQGYMNAGNNKSLKFALMWANHDWIDIHPLSKKNRVKGPKLLYPGKISPETWEKMTNYIIKNYFHHHSYWFVDGKPYFSIYDLNRFMQIFGSKERTKEAIKVFRKKVVDSGLPGLNLNAVVWGRTILPNEQKVDNINLLIKELGFDSFTSYVWIHHVALPQFPQTPYAYVQRKYFEYAQEVTDNFSLPYYPNVTMGWDSTPRTKQDDPYENIGYPFMSTLNENTPAAFEDALIKMKSFLQKYPQCGNTFNINCWNEWTEGSYLEPDTVYKTGYLDAVLKVFGRKDGE